MLIAEGLQVSVAMCTYNGARFVEEQLWSIFGQTFLPKELVVSDDNSSDETLSLVEKTYKDACNSIDGVSEIALKIIRNPSPLGVTKNFEQAIAFCSQQLIALSDQDDVWVPQRLEKMVGEFNRRPDLILLHHDSELVDENLISLGLTTFETLRVSKKEKSHIHNGFAQDVFLKRNLVTGATTILKKEVFENSYPFPNCWVHDEWLAINASFLGNVDFIEELLIKYRQHSANQIGARKIGIKQLIGRMVFPRSDRNQILLRRAEQLKIKFQDSPQTIKCKTTEKWLHEVQRNSFPASRVLRVFPVVKEIYTKRYTTFGLGIQDIIRDLIQSPK